MTCARCCKLCTLYNGIFSATTHVSCVLFKNIHEICLIFFGKENTFEFGHVLVEILQMYMMHNLPHRAQVMTTFLNEIPLKIRKGTVLHFRINTNFVCLTRLRKRLGFL